MIDITGKYWGPAINIPGCEKISEACQNCYAEAAHNMHYANGKGRGFFSQPFNVIRPESKFIEAAFDRLDRYKESQVVFVGNMCDMWHDKVPDSILYQIFNEIESRRQLKLQHTYIFLTKRAARMKQYITNFNQEILETTEGGFPGEFPNVWLGVTLENISHRDRLEYLLDTPAAHRWLSCEPLLGLLEDLCLKCEECYHTGCDYPFGNARIDLVIAGGESGRNARPMMPEWARGIRDQCHAAGVRFHLKQLGDKHPYKYGPNGEVWNYNCPTQQQVLDGIDYSLQKPADIFSRGARI